MEGLHALLGRCGGAPGRQVRLLNGTFAATAWRQLTTLELC
jgi:hypothetical protein